MDNLKNDKDLQRAAFCAIHHMNIFWRQYHQGAKTDIVEPCAACPHGKKCDHWIPSILTPLSGIAGIRFKEIRDELLQPLDKDYYPWYSVDPAESGK